MPLTPETERLLTILAQEVRTFVRAELEQSRIQMGKEMLEMYGQRLACLERELGIGPKP